MMTLLVLYIIGVMISFIFFTGINHGDSLLGIFAFSLLWPGILLVVIGFLLLNKIGIIK